MWSRLHGSAVIRITLNVFSTEGETVQSSSSFHLHFPLWQNPEEKVASILLYLTLWDY